MPARASFAVNDRAATPVPHTFAPRARSEDGTFVYYEAGATAIGEKQWTSRIFKSGDNYKVRLRLAYPIVVTETINGVSKPVIARVNYVDCTFTLPAQSSVQERKDTVGMFANALAAANTQVNDVLEKLEDVY